jgi:DNA ligase-associated metallophosphoesterase
MEWAGQQMELYSERALYLREAETLVIADPHFGKPAAFRSKGVFVPGGTTEADLSRLDGLLERTGARRLMILGDFFHAAAGRDEETMGLLGGWRASPAALPVSLVRGNHDLRAGDPPADWRIQCLEEGVPEGPLAFAHAPKRVKGRFVLAGHLHPSVSLHGGAGDRLRAPCFWFTPAVATLPAFGSFTGTRNVRGRAGDRLFAVGPNAVIEVTKVVV